MVILVVSAASWELEHIEILSNLFKNKQRKKEQWHREANEEVWIIACYTERGRRSKRAREKEKLLELNNIVYRVTWKKIIDIFKFLKCIMLP